ncbi:unnamed protein product [Didymodactylos carnosus]|uniref:Uncharacterized protein n=1 Tax=Didymodactylos carnosus TaxID=1234261 RepID=A0A814DUR8_9BILA|nr:unnamed protein product [Didymodactylos carnosus]CAF3737533.1 unnamed protein product [Didymodactylos carnosus]
MTTYSSDNPLSRNVQPSRSTRLRDAEKSFEHHLRETGPYILAGLGVSSAIFILGNKNIPQFNIPILSSAADRVAYALRYTGIEGLSLVTAIHCVIGTQNYFSVHDPNDEKSNEHVQATQRNLTNTVEQFVAFQAGKLALASISEQSALRLLPSLSAVWLLGRIAYHACILYPSRMFGFTLNQAALFTAYGYFLYRLFASGIHSNLLPFSLR